MSVPGLSPLPPVPADWMQALLDGVAPDAPDPGTADGSAPGGGGGGAADGARTGIGPAGAATGRPFEAAPATALDHAAVTTDSPPALRAGAPEPGAAGGDAPAPSTGTPAADPVIAVAAHAVRGSPGSAPAGTVNSSGAERPAEPALAGPRAPSVGSTPAAEPAAQPLTPAWVGTLQASASLATAWARPWPQDERPPRRERPADDPWDGVDDSQAPSDPLSALEPGTPRCRGDGSSALPPRHLPAPVRAELARGRTVLLLAPAAATPPGHQPTPSGWWLRADGEGGPRGRRCALAGAVVASARWLYWLARRNDGSVGSPLAARGEVAGQPALHLRFARPGRPPPVCDPGDAWIELLEPGLAGRCLGAQWTWLVACAPLPSGSR